MRLMVLLIVITCSVTYGDSFSPAVPMFSKKIDSKFEINRIALGSCYNQTLNGDIFTTVKQTNPDVFLFMGDNVYADDETDDPALNSLKQAYGQLANVSSFTSLRRSVPILTIWDDHDYGLNDAGGDWPRKQAAESLYEYVWGVRPDDPRTQREGIYFARNIGPKGRRVQMIFLDTRYFRTRLTKNKPNGFGAYVPSEDLRQSMLGEDQWQWFEEQLLEPAELRIIISSIMVLSEAHGWESWRMMPKERSRLYDLLKSTQAKGVIIVSGDTHSGGIYHSKTSLNYPLTELNASSLNVPLTSFVKNPQRMPDTKLLGDVYYEANFGLIDIDWEKGAIILQLRDKKNAVVRQLAVSLQSLR